MNRGRPPRILAELRHHIDASVCRVAEVNLHHHVLARCAEERVPERVSIDDFVIPVMAVIASHHSVGSKRRCICIKPVGPSLHVVMRLELIPWQPRYDQILVP